MRAQTAHRAVAASWVALLVSGVAPGCWAQTPAAGAQPAASPAAAADESYQIGPGDVLDIVVFKQPDYSQAGVRVDNDGMIPIARDDVELRAACKTVRQVAAEVKERYKKYLRNPSVYVSIKEFNSQPVAVIGAVNAPGRFQLQRRVRLLEMLAIVNGPAPQAGRTIQVIHADKGTPCDAPAVSGRELVASYDLGETLKAADAANPYLDPGDIVRLPEAEQAYVIGNVVSPKEVALKGPVTLTEAIAAAGGLAHDANAEKITILRRMPNSAARQEIAVSLPAIRKHQASDVRLQADDIVDVPGPTGGRKFLNGLKQILGPGSIRYPLQVIR